MVLDSLCLDANAKPYIPASSLRGYLRHIIRSQAFKEIDALFGLARQKAEAESSGNSGILRLYDCRWFEKKDNTRLISRTSIDAVTGTAKHHHLASHAVVPAQSQFTVRLELDNASIQHLQAILKALQTLGESNKGKLGQGKSTGQGEMHWQQSSLQVLTEKNLKKWLVQNTGTDKKAGSYKKGKPEKKLPTFLTNGLDIPEIKPLLESLSPYPQNLQSLEITLFTQSPLLINDPQAVKQREKKDDKHSPDLVYKVENNHAIIPGTTLKGWARARCRRILLTIIDTHSDKKVDFASADKRADSLLQQMFGGTSAQGCLYFDDAKVLVTQDEVHQQTFNAIDRFTGGVLNKALYQVEAIWPDAPFTGQIHYQPNKLADWMKLLLVYLIKDCMQEDLVLGWGKSKGYGRLQLSLTKYLDWESLYRGLNQEALNQWDNNLQQELNTHRETHNAR